MRSLVARTPPFLPASTAVLFGADLGMWLLDDFAGLTWYGALATISLATSIVFAVEGSRVRATLRNASAKAGATAIALALPLPIAGPALAAAALGWWLLAGGKEAEDGPSAPGVWR